MANSDNAYGLRAMRHLSGSPYNGAVTTYHVAVGDAQVIAPGDPVLITGTADTVGIPTVARATNGSRITGIMAAVANGLNSTVDFDTTLNTVASTNQYIHVIDDPTVIFSAQIDDTLVALNIGLNADLIAAAPVAGKSQWEVDHSTLATTATLQVRVLRLVQDEENALGADAKVEVQIMAHTQAPGTAGI